MKESGAFSWGVRTFDILILVLIGIWIFGGISFQDHLYLKHGADSRRTAFLLGIVGYFLFPEVRESSFWVRGALRAGELLRRPVYRWGVYFLVCFFACLLAALQTLALRVTLYDVGIFHQILWSLTHGLGFHSTISGAGDFLQDHMSPSLALLAPLFRISGGSPFFLPIMHTLLVFGGGAAWIFLAAQVPGVSREFRQTLAAATVLFVVSFDSLWGNLKWGFHENVLGFFSLSWALALIFGRESSHFLQRWRRWTRVIVLGLFLVAAASKEILLLDVSIALGVWAWVEMKGIPNPKKVSSKESWRDLWREWIFPIFLVVLAAGLVGEFIRFERLPHPQDKNYFNRYYSYFGSDLNSFVRGIFQSPGLIVQAIGANELLKYVGTVFLPWLLLPLTLWVWRGKRGRFQVPLVSTALPAGRQSPLLWLGVIIPSFASAALATYPPLKRPGFHYVLELWPVLACLTLVALARFRSERLVWIWVFLSLLKLDQDPIGDFREYWAQAKATRAVRARIAEIPADHAVAADEMAGTWIAGRKWVSRWPDTALLPNQCPDFILLRFAQKGTLADRGIRSILARCQASVTGVTGVASARGRPSDEMVSSSIWREGDWSAYRIGDRAKAVSPGSILLKE